MSITGNEVHPGINVTGFRETIPNCTLEDTYELISFKEFKVL